MMIFIIASIILCLINVWFCSSCPPGKYGAGCNNTCKNPHCFCTNELTCDGCEDGFFNVSRNCAQNCVSPTCTCSKYYECTGCKEGYYGRQTNCIQKCSSACNGNICNDNGTCDIACKTGFTGNICESCVEGKYGDTCSMQCSRGCEGIICNSTDGSCNCSSNFTGEKCESCIEGRYGISCSRSCSPGCVRGICSSSNGNCECKEYYKGDTCDVCIDGRYGDHCLNIYKPNVGAAVGGTVSTVLVVVAVVVIIIIFKRRHNLCCKKPRGEQQLSEDIHTPQPVLYATVQENRPAQQMETGPGHMAQKPHTSFTEHHTATSNTLYEEISFGSHDSNTVQENVQQETGQKGNVESQHVELSMVENTAEYAIIELGGNGLLSKQ
ncbi:multiple epidermal growth factor-like domains protein 10 isoform X2 [Mya arenaria]|uniref:multiple epidermal growth factor-like domains protein 10 isoform X2 n=1 Tax=Mya arenaria TaxID=6604 RepID=UPI0022E116C8|nr:multiple epidermal growth factor-like domains protein 10 isoform X2 [Mya arenaria]